MGALAKWLLHDDQKGLFEVVFAAALTIVFLALVALLLWPLGRSAMTLRLAKGYVLFWSIVYLTMVVVLLLQRIFRVDIDSHFNAFVISNVAVSSFLQAGWSAFAALTVQIFAASTPFWIGVIFYLVGFLSCSVAFNVVSAFYHGHLYRFLNLLIAFSTFLLFSLWPASGRAIYGWIFDLYGAGAS